MPETAALRGLGAVNAPLVAQVQRLHPVREATSDVDASVHPCDEKEGLFAYEGGRGYPPVIVCRAEQELILQDEFRGGNVPAGVGNEGVLEAALAALPEGISKTYVRGAIEEWEESEEWDWQRLEPREGEVAKEERCWAEIPVRSSRGYAGGEARCGGDESRRTGAGADARAPGEVREGGAGSRSTEARPGGSSVSFGGLWCECGLVPPRGHGAQPFLVAFKHLGLPEEWRGERLSTARFRFLSRASRGVRHAGRYAVVLSAPAQPFVEVYLEMRENLKALTG